MMQMVEFGNYVIYLIMLGVVFGVLVFILCLESGLGCEFVNGIYVIGLVFFVQVGIMVVIFYLLKVIFYVFGLFFQIFGFDVFIVVLLIIVVDMGGYQLVDVLIVNCDMWIIVMLVGYIFGVIIVYLILVGLIMFECKDYKYLVLGVMVGLISILFVVLVVLLLIIFNYILVCELVLIGLLVLYYLLLDFFGMFWLLVLLFVFCFLLVVGLKYWVMVMVIGFLVFGKVMDVFIKMVLVFFIVQYFIGVFIKVFGGWGFDLMFVDEKELFCVIEIVGYIGIMLVGIFFICYLFQCYCKCLMVVFGCYLGLFQLGVIVFVMVLVNIIVIYYLFKYMNVCDKVFCVVLGVCVQVIIGDYLVFIVNFQLMLILLILFGKLFGGLLVVFIVICILVFVVECYVWQEQEYDEVEKSVLYVV